MSLGELRSWNMRSTILVIATFSVFALALAYGSWVAGADQ